MRDGCELAGRQVLGSPDGSSDVRAVPAWCYRFRGSRSGLGGYVCGYVAPELTTATTSERSVARCRGRSDELGHVGCSDCPHLVGVDSMIVVSQQDSQATDVLPRHFGIAPGDLIAEEVGCFTDDLE